MEHTIATQLPSALSKRPSVKTTLVDVTGSLASSAQLPCKVYFKNELEQPSGSFKLRGIGYLVQQSIRAAKDKGKHDIHVFASSGGNAGLAAAYSSKFYNVKCTVVVPTCTVPHVVDKLQEFGAIVVLSGKTINDASAQAKFLMEQCNDTVHTIYCHPYDNPLIWEGHAEIMDEVFEELGEDKDKLKGMVCSVGGGGLYNGIVQGLRQHNSLADCLLVETTEAPTLGRAVESGSVVTLDSVKSLATSLACSFVSDQTLNNFLHGQNKSHLTTIDDFDAVRGSLAYFSDFGKAVEPACGAALSLVYNQLHLLKKSLPDLHKDDIIVVVVCGGLCTNEENIIEFKKMVRECHL